MDSKDLPALFALPPVVLAIQGRFDLRAYCLSTALNVPRANTPLIRNGAQCAHQGTALMSIRQERLFAYPASLGNSPILTRQTVRRVRVLNFPLELSAKTATLHFL